MPGERFVRRTAQVNDRPMTPVPPGWRRYAWWKYIAERADNVSPTKRNEQALKWFRETAAALEADLAWLYERDTQNIGLVRCP